MGGFSICQNCAKDGLEIPMKIEGEYKICSLCENSEEI